MKWPYWITALGLCAAALATSLILSPSMGDRVPIHWNIRGEIDGYGPKWVSLYLMPAVMVGMMALFAVLPVISPKPFDVNSFRRTYLFIMVLTVGLFGYIHILTLLATMRRGVDLPRAMLGGMFLFLALTGNVLGKVRRNFYIGVRVPWTLANDRVWNDTHRLAAWLFVACGLIGFVIDMVGYPLISLAPLMVAVVAPIVYSFLLYKRLERRGEL